MQVQDAGVAALVGMTNLRKLGLAHLRQLTCACIDALAVMPSLEDLDMGHCKLSAAGTLSHLRFHEAWGNWI